MEEIMKVSKIYFSSFLLLVIFFFLSCERVLIEPSNLEAPNGLIITQITQSSCDLSWQYSGYGVEDGFKIDRKKDSAEWEFVYQTVSNNVNTISETDLEIGSTYQYRIYAFAGDNNSSSIEAQIKMTLPLPTDFQITQTSLTSCELNWNYSGFNDEVGFKIERKIGTEAFENLAAIPINQTSFTDGNLETDVLYTYKIYVYSTSTEYQGNATENTIVLAGIPDSFVFVEGGTFQMGDRFSEGDIDELPIHNVTLSDFYMAEKEVTQAEYEEVMGDNPSHSSYGVGSTYPVNQVSWYDATTYCNAKSIAEGLTPCYSGNGTSTVCDLNASGYRLPTEAEWEYAARGGIHESDNYKYSGTTNSFWDYGWDFSNSGNTSHEVGTKLPNQLGLYDMSGNLWEWCNDYYDSGYYELSPSFAPLGASDGYRRVLRGGSWAYYASECRVANRFLYASSGSMYRFGFRLVRANL